MTRSSLMLQDQGLTSTDLPKAIVFHEVLGAAMAIGFWSVSVLRGVGHSRQVICSMVALEHFVDKMLCSNNVIFLGSLVDPVVSLTCYSAGMLHSPAVTHSVPSTGAASFKQCCCQKVI